MEKLFKLTLSLYEHFKYNHLVMENFMLMIHRRIPRDVICFDFVKFITCLAGKKIRGLGGDWCEGRKYDELAE